MAMNAAPENSIFSTLEPLARQYVDLMKQRFPETLVFALLFGSVARHEAKAQSDIDLLLAFTELPQSRFARRRMLEPEPKEIETRFLALMDQGIYTRINSMIKTMTELERPTPFLFSALEEGTVLLDTESLYTDLKQRVSEWQQTLGARIRYLGNVRYIELKPGVRWGEVFSI